MLPQVPREAGAAAWFVLLLFPLPKQDSELSWAVPSVSPGLRAGETSHCPAKGPMEYTGWGDMARDTDKTGLGKIHRLETLKKTAVSAWSVVALESSREKRREKQVNGKTGGGTEKQ